MRARRRQTHHQGFESSTLKVAKAYTSLTVLSAEKARRGVRPLGSRTAIVTASASLAPTGSRFCARDRHLLSCSTEAVEVGCRKKFACRWDGRRQLHGEHYVFTVRSHITCNIRAAKSISNLSMNDGNHVKGQCRGSATVPDVPSSVVVSERAVCDMYAASWWSTDKAQREHGQAPHKEGELVMHPPHQAGFHGAVRRPAAVSATGRSKIT